MSADEPSSPIAKFLARGAIIQEFRVNGKNIVQGFATAEQYERHNSPFFGETIGRVANRIGGARIDALNGRSYALAANNGPNCLHGGAVGWGKKVWDGPRAVERHGRPATLFTYLSPDGEEGFPGDVQVRVWYFVEAKEENGRTVSQLEMEYEAELVGPDDVEETVVAMTNHSYFNLAHPAPTIADTEVTLSTTHHQEVNATSIPTGPITPFPNLVANEPFVLGASAPDIDHCFILDPTQQPPTSIPVDTRPLPLRTLVHAVHPASRIHLEVASTEPAFQFYTGRYIDVPAVADGIPARGPRSAFCVEPSRYVNAVNVPEYGGMVRVRRGRPYGARIVYRGWEE